LAAGERRPVDDLGRPAGRELRAGGDVGGPTDLVLVPRDEDTVLGGDQVGLDVVGAREDGLLVRRQGVLGPGAAGASVSDDQRLVLLCANPARSMTIISVSSGVPGMRASSPG